MRNRLVLLGTLFALCAVPVLADTVATQFYDQDGNLLTDITILVINEDGQTQKFGPEADGVYDIVAKSGEKLTFRAADGGAFFRQGEGTAPINLEENAEFGLTRLAADTCADPDPLEVGSVTPGSNVGSPASPEAGDFCGTTITQPPTGQWYTVVGNGNLLTASVCNDGDPATGSADYDSKISVFCQDCDDLTCIGGNDDGVGCADFSSSFSWCSQAGGTYRIFVHGFLGATGNFELAIQDGAPCTSTDDCLPPLPTGACCTCNSFDVCKDIECFETDAMSCADSGGLYAGDDVPCFTLSGTQVPYTTGPIDVPIPDNNAAGASTTLEVPDSITIGDIDADLLINHTWIGDLAVFLTSPSGTEVQLWGRNCGSSNAIDVLFDDDGTQTFCGFPGSPTTGSIPPALTNGFTSFMSDFGGQDAMGTWTLAADDNFTLDTGSINELTLLIEAGISNCEPLCPDVICTVECVEAGGPGPGPGDEESDDGSGDSDDAGPDVLIGEGQDFDGILDFSLTAGSDNEQVSPTARKDRERGKAGLSR